MYNLQPFSHLMLAHLPSICLEFWCLSFIHTFLKIRAVIIYMQTKFIKTKLTLKLSLLRHLPNSSQVSTPNSKVIFLVGPSIHTCLCLFQENWVHLSSIYRTLRDQTTYISLLLMGGDTIEVVTVLLDHRSQCGLAHCKH